MNPFINKPPPCTKGFKTTFYEKQFNNIEFGLANAKRVILFDDEDLAYMRGRLKKYADKNKLKYHTRVIDDSVWVALVEINND